ncbi:hypothetical protein Ddc_18720 [Ditylenchus destructor]|nr:hypothetical protein Ddc_18720 [Ditylenchus destructor]
MFEKNVMAKVFVDLEDISGPEFLIYNVDANKDDYVDFPEFSSLVSYISHIGGFIAGLLLGIVILRNLRLMPWENYARWAALAIFVVYIFTCIVIIVLSPNSVTHSKFN